MAAIEVMLTLEEDFKGGVTGTMLWTCRSPKMSGECKITATLLDMIH
jgi:hypothetical protein